MYVCAGLPGDCGHAPCLSPSEARRDRCVLDPAGLLPHSTTLAVPQQHLVAGRKQ